ncbi:peptidylprolyl isomerase [Celeribacter sp. PS-C1]|uniref:peptidylprolyl isomerase n=1 Tax=Celeribacter sp. PS-C1 TaxID=2820813 RepID=UPI001C6780E6|nr:peptidylprolyl isomerase [Celeribacter sp. PS-C1]MBW6417077.1 peptidylprolyl isomerase [Celeribacter sp. PS-C1]
MTRKFGADLIAGLKKATLGTVCAAALSLSAGLAPATAQNLFAPVAYVNDKVVTNYELNQRIQFMSVLGSVPTRQAALDALIEDRLKQNEMERVGLELTDEQIAQGIQEFASRGNLRPEQFLNLMAREGVSAQTVRDFVGIGLLWREYARARFASKALVSEVEVDRALQNNGPSGGLRVLLSEIFLPARTPEERAQSEALAKQIASRPTIGAFAAAASEYSVAPSREKAGRMDWVNIGDLPPALRGTVAGLKPGEVTSPLSTENAIGMFQLRSVAETTAPTPKADAIKYAAYYIAGGRSEAALKRAATVKASVDSCEDLYTVAKNEPAEVLQIDTLPAGDIPNDVAIELAKLDPGEVSTALTRADGQTLVFLMMCSRSYGTTGEDDREQIRNQLQTQRLGALADSFVAEMRADATIVYP